MQEQRSTGAGSPADKTGGLYRAAGSSGSNSSSSLQQQRGLWPICGEQRSREAQQAAALGGVVHVHMYSLCVCTVWTCVRLALG